MKLKNKKTLATLAAVGTIALALTGCSPSPAQSGSGDHVDLTFWHGYTEAGGKVLDQIVKDFNASQKQVTIKTEIKTWAVIQDTLLPALSAKKGPEIVALPAEVLPVYAAKGAFASMDSFYSDASSNTKSLNKQAIEMETIEGTKYGVPAGFVPLSVFYNKKLFADAGITSFPTTWDEWVDASKKLTIDANGDGTPEQYGLALPDHATVGNGVWASLFYGNGGGIVKDGKTAIVDSAANIETMKFWANAVTKSHISPTGLDGVASDKLFSSGKAAMEVGGPWMASVSQENKIDYGIAAIPAGPKTQASSAIGISMSVTDQAGAAKQAAAEKFFSYFFSKKVATTWSLGSGWPALRTDVTAADVSSNPVVGALTPIAATARPLLPGVVNSTDVLSAVDEATQKSFAGGDPSVLLKAAQAKVQTALDGK